MNSALALSGQSFQPPADRESTVDAAQRVARHLVSIIMARNPTLDADLLFKQLESDYLEWAYQRGAFVQSKNFPRK